MGHHRKHRRHYENMDNNQESKNLDFNNIDINQLGNLFGNGNSNDFAGLLNGTNNDQLSSLLNNIDMNQLSALLSNIDLGQLSSAFSSLSSGNNDGGPGNKRGHEAENPIRHQNRDRRIEILSALKPIVNQERAQFIDTVIQLFAIAQIMKKK